MKNTIYILISLMLSILGCNQSELELIELQISQSTIPEGIVVHPKTKHIYISSIHENNITESTPDGKSYKKILTRSDNGYSFGVGMDIWKDKLYALSSYKGGSYSILSIKDLNTGMLSTFKLNNIDSSYFNDLAIDKKGNAYITDTNNHKVYFFDNVKDSISIFLEDKSIKYPNGIALSNDQSKLFVDSYLSGIRIVDINNKKVLNSKHLATTKKGIDGLKYSNRKLYFIINGGREIERHGLYELNMNDDETDLEELKPILLNHEKMDVPTTLSINNGFIYILANSQMNNLDQEKHEIIDDSRLKNTYIIKLKIEDIHKRK